MATTAAPVKTKITDTFQVTGDGGTIYQVHEHTRYETTKVNGVKTEVLGRAYFLTDDGRGVLKNEVDNTYTIPSLGVTAVR